MSSQMHSIDALANPMRELWLNPADWARTQQTREAQAAEIKKQNRERIIKRVRQLAQVELDTEAGEAVPQDEIRINPADWSRLYEQAEAELQKEDEDFEDDVETSPMSVEEGTKETTRPEPEIIDLTSEAGSPMDVGSSPAAESPMDLASPDDDEESGLVFQETLIAPGTYYCTICGGTYKDRQAFEQHIKDDRYEHGYLDCSFCGEYGIITTFSDSMGLASKFVALQQHVDKYHSDTPPEFIRCDRCGGNRGRKYRTFLGLARHQADKHPEPRPHPCPEC